eukprot:scaffold62654_cov18-Tisochrysis_lutea.AAC.1
MATPAPIVMPSIQKHDLPMHQHGKARVRVARAWRDPSGVHHFVEWTVHTMLESAMEHSFFTVCVMCFAYRARCSFRVPCFRAVPVSERPLCTDSVP